MTIARKLRVTGKVQGVFFRTWTQQQASQLNVCGWVRNCPDGSVEAHVEGEEKAIDELIERLMKGPSQASVDDVDVGAAECENSTGFQVRF